MGSNDDGLLMCAARYQGWTEPFAQLVITNQGDDHMPVASTRTSADDYFKPRTNQTVIDVAARIVALAQGRDVATRTDYAHPNLGEIVKLIESQKT